MEPASKHKLIYSLLKGQAISLLIAGTGFFASLLSNNNVSVPMLLTMLNYILLSPYLFLRSSLPPFPLSVSSSSSGLYGDSLIGHVPRSSSSREGSGRQESYINSFISLSCPWWLYALIAVVDLEANVLVVTAYRYTTVTSVMLLDCFSIPCVMLLSHLFLKAKYSPRHLVGVVVCLMGMACIIISDYYSDNGGCEACSNPIYGDILCLVGTSLYAVSNVMQERMVKHRDRDEYLGMMGVFGTVFAAAQLAALESDSLTNVNWSSSTVGFVIGFVVCLNLMYTRASLFLRDCDAALLNLSLLTSDVYAVIFSFFCYGYLVSWLYFAAFGLACIGLVIYSTAVSPTAVSEGGELSGENRFSKDIACGADGGTQSNAYNSNKVSSANGLYLVPGDGYESYHTLPPTDPEDANGAVPSSGVLGNIITIFRKN